MKRIIKVIGKLLRGVLLVILVIAFVLVAAVTIIGWAATNVVGEPDTYHKLVQEVNIAERGRGFLANFIVSYAMRSGQSNVDFLGEYPQTTWETVAIAIIPEDWLENNLDNVISSIFVWMGEPGLQVPEYEVDLKPINQILHGPGGAMAILPLLQEFPTCESDSAEIVIFGDSLITCIPQDRDITSIGQKIAQAIAELLPEEISTTSLQQAGLVQIESVQTLLQIRAGISILEGGLEFGLRVSVLLFGLYAVLQSSSPKHLLGSLALPLYIAGGVLLLLYGLLLVFLEAGLDLTIRNIFPYLTFDIQTLSVDVLRVLGKQIGQKWLFPALYLIGFAFLFQIVYFGGTRLGNRGISESQEVPEFQQRIRKRFR